VEPGLFRGRVNLKPPRTSGAFRPCNLPYDGLSLACLCVEFVY
jgi:hypothetical protein